MTDIERNIAYYFKDKTLLARALTHSSAGKDNYERLEFLGDRVLSLIMAEALFIQFPQEKEGDLAKRHAQMVKGKTLANIAIALDLADYLKAGDEFTLKSLQNNKGILADLMESLLGAIYLDGGLEPCRTLVMNHWQDLIDEGDLPPEEAKTKLQEWAQGQGKPLPHYELLERKGPDHAPNFVIEVKIEGVEPMIGKGKNKRSAEREAAKNMLMSLGLLQ